MQSERQRHLGRATALLLACLIPACAATSEVRLADAIQITQSTNRLRIEIRGQLLTEYHFGPDVPRPYFYPVIGPGGAGMTRNWPLKETPGEEHDHLHHRGLWYAHGAVNGQDFWTEKPGAGRIVHRGFNEIKSSGNVGIIRSTNDWVAADGKIVCSDERVFRVFAASEQERRFDFEITFHASHSDLTLGDTKEAALSIRVAETMRVAKPIVKGQPPARGDGHIITSVGARDQDAWGKRAAWCDYSGPVNGKTLGIAIFDHPANPKHPTWWMVRDYGLHAANPFGQHDFEKTSDAHAGDIHIAAGKELKFRYRFYLHEGDAQQGNVAARFTEYANTP